MENYLPITLSRCLPSVKSINWSWGLKLSLAPFCQGQSYSDGSETRAVQGQVSEPTQGRDPQLVMEPNAAGEHPLFQHTGGFEVYGRRLQIPYQARPSPPRRESASVLRGPMSRSQLLCAVWAVVSLPHSAPQRSSSFIRETCQKAKVVGELDRSCAPRSPPLRQDLLCTIPGPAWLDQGYVGPSTLTSSARLQTSPEIFHSGQCFHPGKAKRDASGGEQCQLKSSGREMTTEATPQATER